MPTDILLYALIAAALIIWLRNTLGTKNDDDTNVPNPIVKKEQSAVIDKELTDEIKDVVNNNIKNRSIFNSIDDKNVEMGIHDIASKDRNFNPSMFLNGAQDAFVMIVESFAKGDKDKLKPLLAPSVYNAFESAIDERVKEGKKVETEIHSVKKSNIIEAKLDDNIAYVTIRFKAEETCVIRDSLDEIISGNPDKITEMVDVWVFARNVKSNDPTWLLYETREDEIEDHKTPTPEVKGQI